MNNQNGKHEATPNTGRVLSSQNYEFLKWLSLVALPAVAAFYFGLSLIWPGLPFPKQIVGTIALIETLIGALIARSSFNFKKQGADGEIQAKIVGDEVHFSRIAMPNISPEELVSKKSVTIQINPNS